MFSPEEYVAQVNHAVNFLREKIGDFKPIFSLTLGSGLGVLAEQIDVVGHVDYKDIPHFPTLTVEGHKGELLWGYISGVPIIGLCGRKHYYELADNPNAMRRVTFPVQVMASLGVEIYFSTNAVGGLNLNYRTGDLMLVSDHIDLYLPDPLAGKFVDFGGNMVFQPQNTAYDANLQASFIFAARNVGEIEHLHHSGILVARTGRTYETAAVSRLLRSQGADAVGMSTIPEIIVAHNRGMKTIAVSIVTNVIDAEGINATSHEEVVAALNDPATANRLASIFSRFFEKWRLVDME